MVAELTLLNTPPGVVRPQGWNYKEIDCRSAQAVDTCGLIRSNDAETYQLLTAQSNLKFNIIKF